MRKFKSEKAALKAAGDKTVELCLDGKPNCSFRVLKADNGFKVLMVPERTKNWDDGLPFYL